MYPPNPDGSLITREWPGYRYEIWDVGDLLYEIQVRNIVMEIADVSDDDLQGRAVLIEALRDNDDVSR